MTPKEYLSQGFAIDKRIESKLNVITELRASIFGKSNKLQSDRIQCSETYDFTKVSDKIMDFELEVDKHIDELIDIKHRLYSEISQLEDNLQIIILSERYLCGKKLEDIAREQHYSYDYIRHSHGWALESFRKTIPHYFIDTL